MENFVRSALAATISISLVSACGGGSGSDSESVTTPTTPPPVNTAPVATDDSADTLNGQAITIDVLANDSDTDEDTLEVSTVSAAQMGTAEVVDNAILYTPNADSLGVDTFTYEVSDGEATVTGNVTVTNAQQIIISGIVTDSPIANAQVMGEIDGQSFTVTAGEDGRYTVTVTAISDQPIFLTAKGVGDQEQVELVSKLGDVSALVSQAIEAGSRELTDDVVGGAKVTHISSAINLLFNDAYAKDNTLTFDSFVSNIDFTQVVNVAAFIKVLVDNPNFDIPEGESTLSLFDQGDTDAVIRNYLNSNGLLNDDGSLSASYIEARDNAIEATFQDENLAERFTSEEIAGGQYSLYTILPLRLGNGGNTYTFNEDGEGSVDIAQINAGETFNRYNFDWEVVNGAVDITYSGDYGVTFFGYCAQDLENPEAYSGLGPKLREYCDLGYFPSGQFEIVQTTVAESISLVSRGERNHLIANTSNYRISINVDLPDGSSETLEAFFDSTMRNTMSNTQALNSLLTSIDDVSGQEWLGYFPSNITFSTNSYPNISGYSGVMGELLTFNEDGSVSSLLGKEQGTYSFSEGKVTVTMGDETYSITPFRNAGEYFVAFYELTRNGESFSYLAELQAVDRSGVSEFDPINARPIVWTTRINEGIDSEWAGDRPSFEGAFGWGLEADGTSGRYTTTTDIEDNPIIDFDGDYFNFTWTKAGAHIVHNGFVQGTYERRRNWHIVQVFSENDFLVLEDVVMYQPGEFGFEFTVVPRVNRYTEYDWQALFPEVWNASGFSANDIHTPEKGFVTLPSDTEQ